MGIQVNVEQTTAVTLVLSKPRADWLKGYMQNAMISGLNGCTDNCDNPADEDPLTKRYREELFNSLPSLTPVELR